VIKVIDPPWITIIDGMFSFRAIRAEVPEARTVAR
jgi:hypothetical protein